MFRFITLSQGPPREFGADAPRVVRQSAGGVHPQRHTALAAFGIGVVVQFEGSGSVGAALAPALGREAQRRARAFDGRLLAQRATVERPALARAVAPEFDQVHAIRRPAVLDLDPDQAADAADTAGGAAEGESPAPEGE